MKPTIEDPGEGHRLLSFLKNSPERYTVYQPLTIRFLIEQGKEKDFSMYENEIIFKIKSLVFNINISTSALKKNLKSLTDETHYTWKTNLVIFDDVSNPSIWKLNQNEFDESQIQEILNECNNLIAEFHVKNVLDKDTSKQIYFINAGKEGKWYDEFLKIDLKKIIDNKTDSTISIQTAGISYFDESTNFDLNTKTSDVISKLKNGVELNLIKNIKKGDIVAIKKNNTDGIANIGIVIKEYYFEDQIDSSLISSDKTTYNHRIGVTYLNISLPQINDGNIRGIYRAVTTKDVILDYLRRSQTESKYYLLRHNIDGPWKDDLGKKYHFGKTVPNHKKLIEAGSGTKTIWFTKLSGEFYFWGYGTVNEIETIQENVEWNLLYENFKYFPRNYDDSIAARGQFLKKANDTIKQEIENLSNYNQQTSMFPITKKIYEQILSEDLSHNNDGSKTLNLNQYEKILEFNKNLILYGPPGTGKTFMAEEIASHIIKQNNKRRHTWKTITSLVLLENNGLPLNYHEIAKRALEKNLVHTIASTPHETLAKIIREDITVNDEISFFIKTEDGIYGLNLPFTFKKASEFILFANNKSMKINDISKQIIEHNLVESIGETPERTLSTEILRDYNTGDNSTFIKLDNGLITLRGKSNRPQSINNNNNFIRKVTFHPSYSYEDFIEGFRPNVEKQATDVEKQATDASAANTSQPYVLADGIFKEICNEAKNDLENKYVLIIDEINRGNIPKIFGELITVIENGYRGPKYERALAYSKNKDNFYVPTNLYIIATMNTADKSLVQMDEALRRRFIFEELMPEPNLLKDNNRPGKKYIDILENINKKIIEGENIKQFRDRQIGHSFFWNDPFGDKELRLVIKYQIFPLLQDYFYDDYNEIRRILGDKIIGSDNRLGKILNEGNETELIQELRTHLKSKKEITNDTDNLNEE